MSIRHSQWVIALLVLCAPAFSEASETAYVTNLDSGTISVVDVTTRAVTDTIVVSAPSETAVNDLAISPDGSTLYTLSFDNDALYVIDAATHAIVDTVAMGDKPQYLLMSPDGTKLYVSINNEDRVAVVDTQTRSVLTSIPADNAPGHLAFSPDGSRLYVAQSYRQTDAPSLRRVLVVDTSTDTVVSEIVMPSETRMQDIVVTPNGEKAYVGVQDSQVGVHVLDLITNTFVKKITNVGTPVGLALSPDGSQLYVTSDTGTTIAVIDTATDVVTHYWDGFSRASGLILSSDGESLLVTNRSADTLALVARATGVIEATIPVGDSPAFVLVYTDPLTPEEQSDALMEDVLNLDVSASVLASYTANLSKVTSFIEEGKIVAAINQLSAFIAKVEQDYVHGILSLAQRDALIESAQKLIEDLQNL